MPRSTNLPPTQASHENKIIADEITKFRRHVICQ